MLKGELKLNGIKTYFSHTLKPERKSGFSNLVSVQIRIAKNKNTKSNDFDFIKGYIKYKVAFLSLKRLKPSKTAHFMDI